MLVRAFSDRWQFEVRAIPAGIIDPTYAASRGILLIGPYSERTARVESIRVFDLHDNRELLEVRVASSYGAEARCIADGMRLIVATDDQLCDIDVGRRTVNWEYSAHSCIADLRTVPDGDLIVEHEIGISRLRADGTIVWEQHARDLIVASRRESGMLIITQDDEVVLHIDESTGKIMKRERR